MVNDISFSSAMAALAEASYAKFENSGVMQALTDSGFSETQVQYFLSQWQFVSERYQSDMPSDFSATLFQGKADSGDRSGHYILALRGTSGKLAA